MYRILVADKIAEAGLKRLEETPAVEFHVKHGLSPAELATTIGDYDGMLIRSSVSVTADVLARPGRLTAIARAGVGVDNVDLDAATRAGILVLNTPDANTISTAEHTITVMLALHRRVPEAHEHVRSGQWKRSELQGSQVAGRTLGIVGFGRIGRAVARRALALEMDVIAFDPFVAKDARVEGGVRIVSELDELLAQSDCITLHASMSDENRHLIGAEELAKMKPGARLVNCARGALIDEQAVADALNYGKLAGAAIDVYENEPPTDSPLLTARNAVLTPHLAASTAEAQERVSTDAVDSLLAYLLRGEIRSAVNVAGMPPNVTARDRSYFDLVSRLGTVLSCWCAKGLDRLTLGVYGESLEHLAGPLTWHALSAVLGPHLHERINVVNAREHSRSRGIEVDHTVHDSRKHWGEAVSIRIKARGVEHAIEGTVLDDGRPRLLVIDGYFMEIVPERTMVLIFNDDRPGVIGLVGTTLGNAGVNVADMTLSRRGNTALMLLKLDAPLPADVREQLRNANPPILSLHDVTLPRFEDEIAAS